jgi:hemerythrin superfamily protein
MQNRTNAVALLKKDHQVVKKLFAQVQQLGHTVADQDKKSAIFDKIKNALTIHAMIEEEIFYPAVRKARAEHVRDEVREAYEEHKQIKSLIAELSNTSPTDETYNMKLKVLKEDVEHHVREEEGEMFPDAKKYLGSPCLQALSAQLETRKHELEEHSESESMVALRGERKVAKRV